MYCYIEITFFSASKKLYSILFKLWKPQTPQKYCIDIGPLFEEVPENPFTNL